jgi:uncharacterized repeat protein (TIGR01451 family)
MRGRTAAVALAVCAAVMSGCAALRVPRIDPTGERIFAEPPLALSPQYQAEPPPPGDGLALTLSPRVTVAPVGSEVVLLAGALGADAYLRTNRRLEWSLAPGGVGHFVEVGRNGWTDLLLGDFNRPRKVDNTFAIGSTSRTYVRLHRGTPTTSDDVCVLSGQGWLTLTSPVEGISFVTVYAPEVPAWDARMRTATVHWVDAQWRFPPPAINPAGTTHVLTTTVMRQTDQRPCAGWPVRYEVLDGPPAGFAPDGAPVLEVATNDVGQASVEIFQKEAGPGTNRISIQVFRPAPTDGSPGGRLLVGSGTTLKTWTSPDLDVRKTAPAAVGIGATLSYTIEVSNPGDMAAEDVVVIDQLPAALTYLDSNPAAEVAGSRLTWRLEQLGAGQHRALTLHCRAAQPGSVTNCVDATASGGLKAADCATTTVTTPTVELSVTGPQQAAVGETITFRILITNRHQVPTPELLIKDRFDPGLEHTEPSNVISRKLGILAAGESRAVDVTFHVTKAGRLCHRVEVTGAGGVGATAEACVTATEQAAGPPPRQPAGQPSVSVNKTGPQTCTVGETAEFIIDVTNTGSQPLTNLKVVDRYDARLKPTMATDGHEFEGNDLVWTIDALPAGKTTRLKVHCQCLQAVARARNQATAITPQGDQAEDEIFLEIRPQAAATAPGGAAAGGLSMLAGDLLDPVRLGKGLTYEILVSNDGQTTDTQVTVVATVPNGMTPDRIGTSGPGESTITGQTVRFDPVADIRPGEKLSYRVRVLARQPGTLTFRAELTSRNQPQPLIVEETTQVFE